MFGVGAVTVAISAVGPHRAHVTRERPDDRRPDIKWLPLCRNRQPSVQIDRQPNVQIAVRPTVQMVKIASDSGRPAAFKISQEHQKGNGSARDFPTIVTPSLSKDDACNW